MANMVEPYAHGFGILTGILLASLSTLLTFLKQVAMLRAALWRGTCCKELRALPADIQQGNKILSLTTSK